MQVVNRAREERVVFVVPGGRARVETGFVAPADDRDRRQGRIGAGVAGLGFAGAAPLSPPALQLGPEPAEAAQGIEASAQFAAMALHQSVDDRLQECELLGGEHGAIDQELADRPSTERGGIVPAGLVQVDEGMPGEEAQVHGQGFDQQLAIGAITRHDGSPSFGLMDRSGPEEMEGTDTPGRSERPETGPINTPFIVSLRAGVGHAY